MAQSAPAMAQTIEAYVGERMDDARMGPVHWQVLALVASGYFFDVLDFTIFGALVPDLIKSGFVTQAQVPWIGSVTVAGLFVGTLGQGESPTGSGARRSISSTCSCSAWRRSSRHCRRSRASVLTPGLAGFWYFGSLPVSVLAPSSRCASPTPPNTRLGTFAPASRHSCSLSEASGRGRSAYC